MCMFASVKVHRSHHVAPFAQPRQKGESAEAGSRLEDCPLEAAGSEERAGGQMVGSEGEAGVAEDVERR